MKPSVEGAPAPVPLVLLGGGGHASDVLQAIEACNAVATAYAVIGILDDSTIDDRRFAGRSVMQIGAVEDLGAIAAAFVLCVGWPTTRSDLAQRIGDRGRPASPIVHPIADIGSGVVFEEGTVVLGNAHVSPMVRLGRHSLVSYNASIGHDSSFGDFASVMPGAAVGGDVTAGKEVMIGAGAIVREGVRLGDGVRVGAAAAVMEDVADGVTVVGVPARPIAAR